MPKYRDGQYESETQFVFTDCTTHVPKDAGYQNQLFRDHPELLLDRGVVANQITAYLLLTSLSKGGQVGTSALNPNGGQGSG